MKQDPYHEFDDVDGSAFAHHHTLGPGPNQAAPGNHTHDEYAAKNHRHQFLEDKVSILEDFAANLRADDADQVIWPYVIEWIREEISDAVRLGSFTVTGEGTGFKTQSVTFSPAFSSAYTIPVIIPVTAHTLFIATITGTPTRTGFGVACRRVDSANWTNTITVYYLAVATR